MKCSDWDEGWCYAPATKYVSGCVGEDNCEYMSDKKPTYGTRGGVVGQNGPDGEIYLVESVARVLVGKDAEQQLMGKSSGRKRWELMVPKALEVIEIVRGFDK